MAHTDYGRKSAVLKQMKALVDGGYVSSTKSKVGRGGKRWFRITDAGRKAFVAHVEALQALVASTTIDPAVH